MLRRGETEDWLREAEPAIVWGLPVTEGTTQVRRRTQPKGEAIGPRAKGLNAHRRF